MKLLNRISPFARFVLFVNVVIILLSMTKVIKPPPKSIANDDRSSLERIIPDTLEWNHFKDRLGFQSFDRFSKIWITLTAAHSDSTVVVLLSDYAVRLFSFDSLSSQYPHWDPVPLRSVYLSNDKIRIHDSDYTGCQLVYPNLYFIHPGKGQIVSLNLETSARTKFNGKPFLVFNVASGTVVIRESDGYYFYSLNAYHTGGRPSIRVPADPSKTLSDGQNAITFSNDGSYVALAQTISVGHQGLYVYDSTQLKLIYSFDCIDCEQVLISPHANSLLIRDKGSDEYRIFRYDESSRQYLNLNNLNPGAFIETCVWHETGKVFLIKTVTGRQVITLSDDKLITYTDKDYAWVNAEDASFSLRSLYLIHNVVATAGYNPILGRTMKRDQSVIYRMPLQ
jgi:hypothetical protein